MAPVCLPQQETRLRSAPLRVPCWQGGVDLVLLLDFCFQFAPAVDSFDLKPHTERAELKAQMVGPPPKTLDTYHETKAPIL